MIGQVWLHYPNQDLPEEAWRSVGQDFIKALSGYPIAVIERAIERGLKTWRFRPNVAEMVEQCDRVLREAPKPVPRPNDRSHTLGGYTAERRAVLVSDWLNGRRRLVEEANNGGWYDALRRSVEDGANILAQIEWHRRTEPGWKPAARYCENLRHDPVRDTWEIFMAQDKLARWRGRAA